MRCKTPFRGFTGKWKRFLSMQSLHLMKICKRFASSPLRAADCESAKVYNMTVNSPGELLKNMTQRISLNLHSESCHEEHGFQGLAERVPRHDFVSNAQIHRNSRRGTVSQSGRNQSLPNLASPFFLRLFNCFNVRLFDCFSVPCSSVLTFRVKTKIFTLIELLIVIVIIAILVGLFLPALKKVRDKASRIGCVNNLKQVGVLVGGYEGDSGFLPIGAWDNPSGGNDSRIVIRLLADYAKLNYTKRADKAYEFPASSIMKCPATKNPSDNFNFGVNQSFIPRRTLSTSWPGSLYGIYTRSGKAQGRKIYMSDACTGAGLGQADWFENGSSFAICFCHGGNMANAQMMLKKHTSCGPLAGSGANLLWTDGSANMTSEYLKKNHTVWFY